MPNRFITTPDGRTVRDPRSTNAWKQLAKRVIREEPVCWLKFPGICTGQSTTADHVMPVLTHPELALVRSNARGACRGCNRARSSTPVELLRLGDSGEPAAALGIFGDD